MPERGRYTLLTIRGIPVGVDWTWFLILFLIIWLLSGFYRDVLGSAQDAFEPYALAVASAFGFFASILLHELGHAVIAMRNRIGISQITLWMFGGIASLDRDPDTAGAEFRIAAAGPAVTLLITAACMAAGAAIDGGRFWDGASFDGTATISTGVAVLAWLANINAAILVFNLLPAFPLDGGRIVRSIAWRVMVGAPGGWPMATITSGFRPWSLRRYGVKSFSGTGATSICSVTPESGLIWTSTASRTEWPHA